MKTIKKIKLIIMILIFIILSNNINATLLNSMFGFGKDMAFNYISGSNPELAKAISFTLCPQCAATSEVMDFISKSGGADLVKVWQVGKDPGTAAKQEAFDRIYQNMDPQDQKIVDNLQKMKPYINSVFEENLDAPKGQEKATVTIDSSGTMIIKDAEGNTHMKIPKGFDIDFGKYSSSITLINKNADENSVLQVQDFKIKSKKDTKITFHKEGDTGDMEISIIGEGNLDYGLMSYPNLKDATFDFDKRNRIKSANFISTQSDKYTFFTKDGKQLIFNTNPGSNVSFKSELNYIESTNSVIEYENQRIFGDKIITNFNQEKISNIQIIGKGEYSETINNDKLIINTDKDLIINSEIGSCLGSKISCLELDSKYRYLGLSIKNSNKVKIDSKFQFNYINSQLITDDSKIIYNDKFNNEMFFSKEPLLVRGDLSQLPLSLDQIKTGNKICQQYVSSSGSAEKCGELMSIYGSINIKQIELANKNALKENGIGLFYGSTSLYGEGIKRGLSPNQALGFVKNAISECDVKQDCGFKCLPKEKDDCLSRVFEKSKGIQAGAIKSESGENINPKFTDCMTYVHEISLISSKDIGAGESYTKITRDIFAESKRSGVPGITGIALSKKLEDLNWEGLYLTLQDVGLTDKKYCGVDISESFTNLREDKERLKSLKEIPFGIVSIQGGEHTALLNYGKLCQSHWSYGPTNPKAIECCDIENIHCGFILGREDALIMLPPGTLKKVKGSQIDIANL